MATWNHPVYNKEQTHCGPVRIIQIIYFLEGDSLQLIVFIHCFHYTFLILWPRILTNLHTTEEQREGKQDLLQALVGGGGWVEPF